MRIYRTVTISILVFFGLVFCDQNCHVHKILPLVFVSMKKRCTFAQ